MEDFRWLSVADELPNAICIQNVAILTTQSEDLLTPRAKMLC
jgi:hypothetical protein